MYGQSFDGIRFDIETRVQGQTALVQGQTA